MVAMDEADDVSEDDESQYQKGVRHLCEKAISKVPGKYILPIEERPACEDTAKPNVGGQLISLPTVDFAELRSPSHRPRALRSLVKACEQYGFFQVGSICSSPFIVSELSFKSENELNKGEFAGASMLICLLGSIKMQLVNHGIPSEVISGMMDASMRFFEQPYEERAEYMSSDMMSAVRYGTSFNQRKDRVFCWRDFLKLTCHPMSQVLPHWPSSPADLR